MTISFPHDMAMREDIQVFPTSFAQQRLWFFGQSEPDSAAYSLPVTIGLRGLLDVSVLERSLNAIVQRHEALRTTFRMIDGQPVQVIASTLIVSLPVVDLQDLPEAERDAQVLELVTEAAYEPFNLAQGPLVRATLLRLNEEEHVLLLTAHHIVLDNQSTNVFIRELAVLYESFSVGRPSSLPDLPIQYADYARQQRERLQGDVLAEHHAYWKQQLSEAPATLPLPTDSPSPAARAFEGAQQSLVLSKALTEALQGLSRQEDVTLFMTLLAAFQILLQRYTGQEDLVIGSSILDRTQTEVEGVIGCFVNTLALRTNLSGNPSFRELLARVREVYLGAYAHADLPFELLLEELQPERNLNLSPTFDVMINLITTPPTILELPGLTISSMQMTEPVAKCALTLYVEAQESDLSLRLVYQRARFSPERIARMLNQFQYLLEQITAAPEKPIQFYSLVTPESLHVLPNPCAVLPEPQYELITHMFASWARQAPQHPAVCQEQQTWTYSELAESASTLARVLLAQGLKPGDVVAVLGVQSFGLIASMIAVFLSGGVLLPVDRTLPTRRQQLMLREAEAKHLLYSGDWRLEDTWVQEFASWTPLRVDPDKGRIVEPKSTLNIEAVQLPIVHPNDAAYIFFTSGTTGIPKGVLGCHKGLSHFLSWQRETFAVGPQDRCAQLTNLSFDVVLRAVFLPLTSGATLCLPEKFGELAPDQILLWLEREKISLLHTVPALAQSWLANIPSGVSLRFLRWVFFAGEPLTDVLVQRWRAAFPEAGEIANFYGPTETSLAKCSYIVNSDTAPGIQPVGWPLPQTQALVLTESNQLCGIGELGEIVLRTPFRSLGYINAPEENRKRFIKNPFRDDEGDLLYRTGDRGRYRLDGSLEILGRLDHQVKIRGVRVEPDEVAAILQQHPLVRSCAVVVQKNEHGENALVAYVAIPKQERVTSSELRSYLSRQLPSPMVPSVFVLLEALPLLPNGKVDRRALPPPDYSRRAQDFVAPSTPLQEMVAASWSRALNIEQIGIHDNFFALGGHSLLVMQVIAHLRITLRVELSLRSFFEAPTIAQLAERISQLQADEMAPSLLPTIEAVSRESYRRPVSALTVGKGEEGADEVVVVPTSLQQQGLWLADQLKSDSSAYNLPITLRLRKRLDMSALEQSLQALVQRHETLRTIFVLIHEQPMQVIAPGMRVPLTAVDLRTLSHEQQEVEVHRLVSHEVQQPFDLAHGPLLRAMVLHLGAEEHLVLLVMHHIISDGWSVGVIGQDLAQLYDAYVTGSPAQLVELPLQYADFALWQREWLQEERLDEQLTYWRETLAGAPSVLELPTDHPRPALPTHHGAVYSFTLSQALSEGLRHLSRQEGVTLYMTLVAAFVALLQCYTGQDDVVIGTTTAGRSQQETKDLIGYFVNTLVLRTDVGGNPSVREVLARVREAVLGMHAHQEVPFERLVKELQPERSLSQHPIFQALLTLDPPLPALASAWEFVQMSTRTVANKFDLALSLSDRGEGLAGCVEYSSDLFEDATIVRMMKHWQTLLEAMIADPEQPIAHLPLLTERERQQLLVDWNATQQSAPDKCFPQLFEEQVLRTPDAIALVFEHQQVSYRELNRKANQLAHYLQGVGVGPEVMVGLCVERSPEMLIGLLGILKAGGVYVPVDPEYPQERLTFLLQDTQMPVLLTQHRLLSRLPHQHVQLVCLDTDWDTIAQYSEANPISGVKGEHLAYVIYTSGSTGQPKGVLIPHRALATHCWSMTQVYELQAEDRILQFSSFTFDASLEQILPTLLVGAQLVLRGQEVWSPAQLLKQIKDGRLTSINLPPAYWHQVAQEWMNEPESLLPNHLRLVIVGGDRLLPQHLHLWRQTAMRSVRLLNAYGPTETTITATLYDTAGYTAGNTPCESVPIGRPLPNRRIYILDRAGTPVPIGVPGELHIGGDLLARGYLHRPELTAERFIADPFSNDPQARLYKTGDLARYLADGTIEFLGRVDQQVKIRGFRIELGEIEEVLSQHPTVHEAVVVAREDIPGDKYLAAYVVARQGQAIESQALRSYLQQKLPNYMLPTAFVFLERLPLLSTGKIDRRALPAPKLTKLQEEETFVAPRLLIHQQLVQIWEKLLDVRPIGIRDNFFHLGGHSLLAARLVDRIERVFGKRIALSTLFSGPTIEQLAEALQHQEKPDVRTSVFPIQLGGSKRPFFFLHGDWTGGAFYCFALARALGPDQPFYVLEPYKFSGLQNLPSFEAVAAAHIESLRAIQPEGPYLLGGFCNGGLLAYEMARQLQVAGERVDFLALINPSAPVQFKTMRAISKRISSLQRLGVNTKTHLFLRARHALRHVYRTLYPSSSRVQDFYKLLAIDPRLEGIFPPVEALYNDYVGVFTWLVSRYETGIYPGKITFFWASEEPSIEKTWLAVTRAKDSEDIENHIVPGTHMSCVTEYIQDLAECLSICASRVQGEVLNQK